MEPSHYGLFGLMIAAATILAASICYRIHLNPDTFIKYGAMIVTSGGLLLTLLVNSSLFDLSHIGLLLTILTLFSIFFGIGLIIPNSLSHALKHFQKSLDTAGSIFGALYYIFIAFSTWIMSLIHTGSPLPLPLYMTVLGGVLITGSLMIKNLSDNF